MERRLAKRGDPIFSEQVFIGTAHSQGASTKGSEDSSILATNLSQGNESGNQPYQNSFKGMGAFGITQENSYSLNTDETDLEAPRLYPH